MLFIRGLYRCCAKRRGAVCEANICEICGICVQKRARSVICMQVGVRSISHADDADDADLPCGVREGNMKTLKDENMKRLGGDGNNEKII